jgi:hypothetical protein
MLNEDISTHLCTSIASAISGVIVLLTTYLLLHQRKSHSEISDIQIVETMLMSFIFSYTLVFTAFEPLRAGIKASYVSFAHCPQCFLKTYPLIYHRLSRLSAPSNEP